MGPDRCPPQSLMVQAALVTCIHGWVPHERLGEFVDIMTRCINSGVEGIEARGWGGIIALIRDPRVIRVPANAALVMYFLVAALDLWRVTRLLTLSSRLPWSVCVTQAGDSQHGELGHARERPPRLCTILGGGGHARPRGGNGIARHSCV